MSERRSVAVIGGGVTGLTAAYRLLQAGHAVQVFEAAARPGGLVRTFDPGGEPVECFYHHLFKGDAAAVRLFDELGVNEALEWRRSRIGVYRAARVHPFTTPLDLLRFSPLGIGDRIRLGLMGVRLRREKDGEQFENVTAAEWLRREIGERALEVVWGPLLRGKFGDRWDEVVMTWLWNKIHTRFASREGLLGHEVLGYMRGSFATWTERLIERIGELGGAIRTQSPVDRIESGPSGPAVEAGGESERFDAVVATVANEIVLRMAPGLPGPYAEQLRGTRYQDALCLVLALDRPLTGYYWLNVNEPDAPFVAVVEHTNLVGAERYAGRHIVYVSRYVEPGSPALGEDADTVLRQYMPHLQRINPSFDESWIGERWLFHARDAQPVFTVGAGARVPPHRTPLPGVYLANMAQIYPQDRGQNYSIEMGDKVARIVTEDLSPAPARYQV